MKSNQKKKEQNKKLRDEKCQTTHMQENLKTLFVQNNLRKFIRKKTHTTSQLQTNKKRAHNKPSK